MTWDLFQQFCVAATSFCGFQHNVYYFLLLVSLCVNDCVLMHLVRIKKRDGAQQRAF